SGMPTDRDATGSRGMLVLPVTTFGHHSVPSIGFNQGDHVSYLHSLRISASKVCREPAERLALEPRASFCASHGCACSARAGQLLAAFGDKPGGGQCSSLRCLSLIAANSERAAPST